MGGAFLPGNPRYSYMYKTRGTPPHDITLIKTKITGRDGKRFISTFLRGNSGLWTVYNLWAISVEVLFVYDLMNSSAKIIVFCALSVVVYDVHRSLEWEQIL